MNIPARLAALCLCLPLPLLAAPEPLFNGKTLAGWNGDTNAIWHVKGDAIEAGKPGQNIPRNEFLVTEREFGDFELTLKFKMTSEKGFANAGVQIRSQRVPNNHEMSGYQADLGEGYWGCIYDESRRNKVLARPADDAAMKAVLKPGEWNDYRIRCQGPRIQLWINGVAGADFTETDPAIPLTGRIGLQIHGGGVLQMEYKDIGLEKL